MKIKSHIGFRAQGWDFAPVFFEAVKKLKVEESDFIRLCVEKGFAEATKQIDEMNKEKKQKLDQARENLGNFNWPLAPFIGSAVAVS